MDSVVAYGQLAGLWLVRIALWASRCLHGTDNGTDSQVDEQGENIMPPLQAIQPAEHLVHKISPGAVIGRNKQ